MLPISVIICNRNRARLLDRCLTAAKRADAGEIIVVDGNSTDSSVLIAAKHAVRLVTDGGRGLGAARQTGAAAATHDLLAYVDTDAVLRPETLRDLHAELKRGRWDAVQARLASLDPQSFWQRYEAKRREIQERPGRALVIGCQATLVRRSLVVSTGFDDAFDGAAEDHDLWFRARTRGARIAHAARATAYHEDRAGTIAFVRQRIWHGRGMARLLIRHRTVGGDAPAVMPQAARDPLFAAFLVASWWATAVGILLEALDLAHDASTRKALRAPRASRDVLHDATLADKLS